MVANDNPVTTVVCTIHLDVDDYKIGWVHLSQ